MHTDLECNSYEKNGAFNPAFDRQLSNGGSTCKVGTQESCEKTDPFAVCINDESDLERTKSNPILNLLKCLCVILLLYLFICSLDFMGSAFRMISGRATGQVLQHDYIQNPIVGLMIGILVTVLVQSSSTSTSIIVSMVNSEILFVREAIPMILGSNIGTSVTNTIVSFTQIADKAQFRRAFAGATVHDMFNWLSVITLLCIEIPTHMLEKLSGLVVDKAFVFEEKQNGTKVKILKYITEPFTKIIVQIDKKVLTGWSQNDTSYDHLTLNPCENTKFSYPNNTGKIAGKCNYLFAMMNLDDTKSGILLLILSLFLLCFALIMIVKLLKSMLKGTIARVIKKAINSDIPYVPWLTGYFALLIGAVMTVIVQSSSIFTSTITPLIGLGLISVDRAYPLTLGSNIGTTTTSLLASISGEGTGLKNSVQIALVHLFFNVIGILIFYPIPFMRWPIPMCKVLGNITAEYRWFAICYLILMFFVLPVFVFGLSLGGTVVLAGVGIPLIILLVAVSLINVMQNKIPRFLPVFLRTWEFLPLPLRSLEPYNTLFLMAPCCKTCRISDLTPEPMVIVDKSGGVDNPNFGSENSKL